MSAVARIVAFTIGLVVAGGIGYAAGDQIGPQPPASVEHPSQAGGHP